MGSTVASLFCMSIPVDTGSPKAKDGPSNSPQWRMPIVEAAQLSVRCVVVAVIGGLERHDRGLCLETQEAAPRLSPAH